MLNFSFLETALKTDKTTEMSPGNDQRSAGHNSIIAVSKSIKFHSDKGGSRSFIGEGLRVLRAPLWLLKGRIYLEGAVTGRKGDFARQKGAYAGWRGAVFASKHRGPKGRLFVSEERLCWPEGAHIPPSVQK